MTAFAGQCRILHLEDSAADAELVAERLHLDGFIPEVERVETRRAFTDALIGGGPAFDLILADLALPDFDGVAALAIARKLAPDIPFIFVSGTLGEDEAIEAVKAGATDYVIKQRLRRLPVAIRRALAEVRERIERRAAEAELGKSEARLARLLATTPAGVVEFSAEGRVAYANPAAERLLGAEPGGLVGRRYDDLAWQITDFDGAPIPPERLPGAWGLRGEQVLDYGYTVTALDGRRVAMLVDVAPVRGADGRVEGALAAFQDVTARHAASQALRASEERLRLVIDSAADYAILTTDRERRLTSWSAGAAAIFGYGADDILGRSADLLFTEEDRAAGAPEREAGQAWREGRAPDVRWHRRRDGTRVFLRGSVHPLHDGAGREVGLLKVARDETEARRAEEQLHRSEARLRALVSASSEVLYSMSPDWAEVRQLAGGPLLADTEGPNRTWLDEYIPADERPRVLAAIQEAVRTKGVFEIEHRVQRADGSVGWTLSRAVPLLDAAGAVTEWFGAASDVTARKAAEAALREANATLEARVTERTAELRRVVDALRAEALERERAEAALRQSQKMEAVGQLTGGIAHDFNNMLQAIGGNLEMMQRRVVQGRAADADRYAEGARATVERAAALTHRLLAFARRQALQPEPVEPDELVEGVAELIRRTVGPAVQVELRLDDGIWSVLCDPNQLENVLLNLAINARDAMAQPSPGGSGSEAAARSDGSRLTIATAAVRLTAADVAGQEGAGPGEYVEIAVADTGSGMDEATRARAFEPFFTTKPIGQGTGLGLSQVYGFVRQSGGVVRLDSTPGRGTVVRLYLPRHEPAQERPAQSGPGGGSEPVGVGVGGTVLLVEDEAMVRAVAAEQLRELGYAVLEAGDGSEALRVLRGSRGAQIDLLVTDVGLPRGLNGRQVAEAARERHPGLPVLFITGYAGGVLEKHLAPGMAVIGKPFALDALAKQVGAMLEATPVI